MDGNEKARATPDDALFRSHFEHVNRLADRAYESVEPAYRLGSRAAADERYAGRPFEEIETDLENGWLSVRTQHGEWASVRDYARTAFERGLMLGFNLEATLMGGTTSHHRPSFSDPIAGGIDPTAPDSPERTPGRSSPPAAGP